MKVSEIDIKLMADLKKCHDKIANVKKILGSSCENCDPPVDRLVDLLDAQQSLDAAKTDLFNFLFRMNEFKTKNANNSGVVYYENINGGIVGIASK